MPPGGGEWPPIVGRTASLIVNARPYEYTLMRAAALIQQDEGVADFEADAVRMEAKLELLDELIRWEYAHLTRAQARGVSGLLLDWARRFPLEPPPEKRE